MRNKNALRIHEIQDYVPGQEPTEDGWLQLAHLISDISDSTNESTEEEAWYDGDGTPEETVTSVAEAYDVEGQWDSEDGAQVLIESKKRKIGDERKVWHRITRSDGKKRYTGRATALNIVAGSGNAAEYEAFGCTLRYDHIPAEEEITP